MHIGCKSSKLTIYMQKCSGPVEWQKLFQNRIIVIKKKKISTSYIPWRHSTGHKEVSLHIKVWQHAADSIQHMLFPHGAGIIQGHLDKYRRQTVLINLNRCLKQTKKKTLSKLLKWKNMCFFALFFKLSCDPKNWSQSLKLAWMSKT